jgi:hypothetical protein
MGMLASHTTGPDRVLQCCEHGRPLRKTPLLILLVYGNTIPQEHV